MSYYFNIHSKKNISYLELADKLKKEEVRFSTDSIISENPIQWTKIYIPNRSTRGVTIKYDNNSYSIDINVIASVPDFQLALLVTKNIARITGSMIYAESLEEAINPENFDSKFDDRWIDNMKTHGVNIFLENIGEKNQVLSIGGCYMNYYVGPNIHKTLDSSSESKYYDSLVKHIQNTQFFDLDKYRIPNTITVTNEETSKSKNVIVFSPFSSQFYPKADIIVFKKENERYEIPYTEIRNIKGKLIKYIDEEQFLIDQPEEQEINKIFDQIRAIHSKERIILNSKTTDQKNTTKKANNNVESKKSIKIDANRKWWEFWK